MAQALPRSVGRVAASAASRTAASSSSIAMRLRPRRVQLDNGLCVDRMQLATGLLVACELFPEFGGHGLRYGRHAPPMERGCFVGAYPRSAGLVTVAKHEQTCRLVGEVAGAYALQLDGRVLYAARGQCSIGAMNEAHLPNVEFVELLGELEVDDHSPLVSLCVAVTTQRVAPGDMLHVSYGDDYAGVRVACGYEVEPRRGPLPRAGRATAIEVGERLVSSLSNAELRVLCDAGGVLDFANKIGTCGDPNVYWGGPPPVPPPATLHAADEQHEPPAETYGGDDGASGTPAILPPLVLPTAAPLEERARDAHPPPRRRAGGGRDGRLSMRRTAASGALGSGVNLL